MTTMTGAPPARTAAELEELLGGPHRLTAGAAQTTAASADPDEEAAAWEWLHHADSAFLACRHQHAFPKLVVRNGKLPRGITAEPLGGGHFQIRQVCRDCKLPRVFTVTGDIFAPDRHYTYDYAALPGYRMPKNALSYIGTEDIKRELWRRALEVVQGGN